MSAVIALVLASIGIYGVPSYSISQRTQEIEIRMALGAGRPYIIHTIVLQGARMAGVGIAMGAAAAVPEPDNVQSVPGSYINACAYLRVGDHRLWRRKPANEAITDLVVTKDLNPFRRDEVGALSSEAAPVLAKPTTRPPTATQPRPQRQGHPTVSPPRRQSDNGENQFSITNVHQHAIGLFGEADSN